MTAETAEDLMFEKPFPVRMDDTVNDILEIMIEKNTEEVPVLDEAGKVVGDVTMVDLMKILKNNA